MASWESFDKFDGVIEEYMLPRGEGDTMASQIVTAVNKLVYKAFNDGDVFDNTHHLRGWCNDLSSYANWLYKYAEESQDILEGIENVYTDDEYTDLLYELAVAMLNREFLSEMSKSEKVGTIYDCDGPFKFVEDWDEEEEEDEEEEDEDDEE